MHRTKDTEHFGPVRLGPQDLRDLAAVFWNLDSKAPPRLPVFKTEFNTGEHKSTDIEDVLAFADSDTLPSLHIISAELRISFHASPGRTTIYRPRTTEVDPAVQRAVDEAEQELRQIVESREVTGLAAFRQTGPDKWGLIGMLLAPVAVSLAAVALLGHWISGAAANAVAWGVLWLCYVPLLVLTGKPRDLIRLRGRDLPWWERRTGLVALVGVVLSVVVPLAIYGLESLRD